MFTKYEAQAQRYLYNNTVGIISLCLVLLLYNGCDNPSNKVSSDSKELQFLNVNQYPLNKVSCDPLDGNNQNNDLQGGLTAELFYLTDTTQNYQHVEDYIANGVQADQFLFFSQLNVPTRLFTAGFPTTSGGLIKKDSGQVLDEYFALRFHSTLKLAPEQEEGTYELALLSDDGAIWSIRDEQGVYQPVVSNDGVHPTRFGCGTKIEMTHETELVMRLDYYQGPRFHISLIPMWRKVDATTAVDPLCNQYGNNLFFDPDNGSVPKAAYNALLSRGWMPLEAANYRLPQQAGFNPCVEGTPAIITNFKVTDEYDGKVVITWNTNIPATSQVLYGDLTLGEEQKLTNGDNILTTDHEVVIIGLKTNHNYSFQALSITSDYGKSMSMTKNLVLE